MNRFFAIIFLSLTIPLIAEKQPVITIEPYTQNSTPSWLKNARRTEIVTIGSIPFTVLTTTLVYSFYRYAKNDFNKQYIPNPFPTSSKEARLTTDEQLGILFTSLGLSLAIGLTDFIVMQVKDSKRKKELQQRELQLQEAISIEKTENELLKKQVQQQEVFEEQQAELPVPKKTEVDIHSDE